AVGPGGAAAAQREGGQPQAVGGVAGGVEVGGQDGALHLGELGGLEQLALQQRDEEPVDVGRGADQRAGGPACGDVLLGEVDRRRARLQGDVAVRVQAADG